MRRLAIAGLLVLGVSLGGCSCRHEQTAPAPDAPDAPDWGRTAKPPTAFTVSGTQARLEPIPITAFPPSRDPPAYNLPLEIKLTAPEVPREIREPSPPQSRRKP